jgi:hypothetical protein
MAAKEAGNMVDLTAIPPSSRDRGHGKQLLITRGAHHLSIATAWPEYLPLFGHVHGNLSLPRELNIMICTAKRGSGSGDFQCTDHHRSGAARLRGSVPAARCRQPSAATCSSTASGGIIARSGIWADWIWSG